jgi:CubicO group peptidase (beta-lactamase class C family)
MFTLLLGLLLTAAPAPAQQDLPANLLELCETLEAKRQEYHIPGMALVIVHNDQVLLARGFGVAETESGKRVDADTLFCIGSSTKSFTSAAVGMMVEAGKMSWDDPVNKHLPGFQLNVDGADDDVVLMRDVLSHRTGFPRMSVLFASGKVGRSEILETVANAKPWKPFRQQFYYNNVQFLAAGEALAAAAGISWDEFIQQRFFSPLGMKNSFTTLTPAQKSGRFHDGYIWLEDRALLRKLPARDLNNIAPAGSIISGASDMSRWLKLLLKKGSYNGEQLFTPETLQACWEPQITMGETVGYGMGWMLREWDGRKVMEHGGNIDGFSSSVALIPEENLGFALFYNLSVSPLQSECLPMVWEAVLNAPTAEESLAAADQEAIDFEPYVGKYIADFGSFKDQRFTVQVKDGSLAVDVPGQMLFELKDPNEDGKWYFALTDTIAVSFDKNDDGEIELMHMYQGGMDMEFPREGFEIKGELPLAELKPYLGKYRFEEEDQIITLVIKNNRLAVDVPGQMVFELAPPDENGKWAFRALRDVIQVSFEMDENGVPVAMHHFQGGEERIMPRIDDEGGEVTTLATVIQAMNLEARQLAYEKAKSLRLTVTGTIDQSGIEMTGTEYHDLSGRLQNNADFGKFGKISTTITADDGWTVSDFSPTDTINANKRQEAKESSVLLTLTDFRGNYDKVFLEGEGEHDGIAYWELSAHRADHPAMAIYVEKSTGDIRRVTMVMVIPGAGGLPGNVHFNDYREVQGLRIPHEMVVDNEASGSTTIKVKKVETGVQPNPGQFKKPKID